MSARLLLMIGSLTRVCRGFGIRWTWVSVFFLYLPIRWPQETWALRSPLQLLREYVNWNLFMQPWKSDHISPDGYLRKSVISSRACGHLPPPAPNLIRVDRSIVGSISLVRSAISAMLPVSSDQLIFRPKLAINLHALFCSFGLGI